MHHQNAGTRGVPLFWWCKDREKKWDGQKEILHISRLGDVGDVIWIFGGCLRGMPYYDFMRLGVFIRVPGLAYFSSTNSLSSKVASSK